VKTTKRSTPRRRRLEVDERREQLLALGVRMFADKTYDEVSIDAIARKAGVSKGLLYHYFPTKRDFYVAGVREGAKQLFDETRPAEGADPLENLRNGLNAYLSFVKRNGKAYVGLMRGGIGSDAEVAEILDQTRGAIVERVLAQLPATGHTAALKTGLRGWVGFVEGLATEWLLRPTVSAGELVSLAESVLVAIVGRLAAISE
jgi:AcrR family transcriptional regulator